VSDFLPLLKKRLAYFEGVVSDITATAAPLIERVYVVDSTTKRGNVASYQPGGENAKPSARASGDRITVSAVDWSMRIAVKRGQPAKWIGILERVAREKMRATS